MESGRRFHDLGGQDAGPVGQEEHDYAPWEKRLDAIRRLLSDDTRRLLRTDELRRGIEALGAETYRSLSYYERWTASLQRQMVDKGILTQDEIDARVAQVRARLAATGELELSPEEESKCR